MKDRGKEDRSDKTVKSGADGVRNGAEIKEEGCSAIAACETSLESQLRIEARGPRVQGKIPSNGRRQEISRREKL